jgi:hypothetical protein
MADAFLTQKTVTVKRVTNKFISIYVNLFHFKRYELSSCTGLEKMIATSSRAKIVIVRERPISYSDCTSFNTLIKFVSTIIVLMSGL